MVLYYCIVLQNYQSRAHGGIVMPAIWFRYDLTPITVSYTQYRKPFYHFLTMVSNVCRNFGSLLPAANPNNFPDIFSK